MGDDPPPRPLKADALSRTHARRLRQVDVKAEHFERQVARIEQERDQWEKKCEEAQEKYNKSQQELDEVRLTCSSQAAPRARRRGLVHSASKTDSSSTLCGAAQLARAMQDI